jgi:hypothetical protein
MRLHDVELEEMQIDALASIDGSDGNPTPAVWKETLLILGLDCRLRKSVVWLTESSILLKNILSDLTEAVNTDLAIRESSFSLV